MIMNSRIPITATIDIVAMTLAIITIAIIVLTIVAIILVFGIRLILVGRGHFFELPTPGSKAWGLSRVLSLRFRV